MSRRSRRSTAKRVPELSPAVRHGLASLIDGNEPAIRRMLDSPADTPAATLLTSLVEVMGVNSLSVEMMLSRFFDRQLLSTYCVDHLGKSGKGTPPVLAARISKVWQSSAFAARLAKEADAAPVQASAPLSSSKRRRRSDEQDGRPSAEGARPERPAGKKPRRPAGPGPVGAASARNGCRARPRRRPPPPLRPRPPAPPPPLPPRPRPPRPPLHRRPVRGRQRAARQRRQQGPRRRCCNGSWRCAARSRRPWLRRRPWTRRQRSRRCSGWGRSTAWG